MEPFNPLWILVALAVGTAIVKGLFWLRDVHTAKQGWADVTEEIRKDIKRIFHLLRSPVSGDSPLRLNTFGRDIAAKFGVGGAEAWAAHLAPSLEPAVAGMADFEIDGFADKYVRGELDAQTERSIAKCAYEVGADRDVVLLVLRVVLRDALLAAQSRS